MMVAFLIRVVIQGLVAFQAYSWIKVSGGHSLHGRSGGCLFVCIS